MHFSLTLFLLFSINIISIFCLYCNTKTIPPKTEYHCSGLTISETTHPKDTHCCLWKYFNKEINRTTYRCSSINITQFNNLDAYIARKTVNYTDLDIKCVSDQELYCSNILLDDEDPGDCKNMKIDNNQDTHCCKWDFTDSTNNNKHNSYCASINQYEYETVSNYVKYKKKNKKYKDLQIDCAGNYLKIIRYFNLLFFLLN